MTSSPDDLDEASGNSATYPDKIHYLGDNVMQQRSLDDAIQAAADPDADGDILDSIEIKLRLQRLVQAAAAQRPLSSAHSDVWKVVEEGICILSRHVRHSSILFDAAHSLADALLANGAGFAKHQHVSAKGEAGYSVFTRGEGGVYLHLIKGKPWPLLAVYEPERGWSENI